MYLPEEWAKILWVAGAAVIGRLLAKRKQLYHGRSRFERLKAKILDWLWEVPTLVAITLVSYEGAAFLALPERTAMVMAVVIGYLGIETTKTLLLSAIKVKT